MRQSSLPPRLRVVSDPDLEKPFFWRTFARGALAGLVGLTFGALTIGVATVAAWLLQRCGVS